MRYLLDENVALRGWRLVPRAYYKRGALYAAGLTEEEYGLLSLCDGETDIAPGGTIERLSQLGLCAPAAGRSGLTAWQRPRFCDNRYFPSVNWAITGKCNFNCLHCFNAKDNAPIMDEFAWEQCVSFIGQLDACGVKNVTFTGGEPMLHPRFMDAVREVARRGMEVAEITTNGSFITPEVLDAFDGIGVKPLIKISFDGLGHHDWFRGEDGAEERTLGVIRLLLERGFIVRAQMNFHKGNMNTVLPTLKYLDAMGVQELRLIRTSESPRWKANGEGLCVPLSEWYDAALRFAREYIAARPRMSLDIWHVLHIVPARKLYHMRPIVVGDHYRDSLPVCRGNRGMIAVTPSGEIVPCNQISGQAQKLGDRFGNVHETPLRELLCEGAYIDAVTADVGRLRQKNEKCQTCAYWEMCAGGCRACGYLLNGGYLAYDPIKCMFFEGGYIKKTMDMFAGAAAESGAAYRCVDNIPQGLAV
jgi:radical SAM protein with 4Fe4S-binding SPASM domain